MNARDLANGLDSRGLRERNNLQHAPTVELAKETVQKLNAEEYLSCRHERHRRTFGRTASGVGKLLLSLSPGATGSLC